MQERLLGALLGCAATGVIVFEQRKRIYKSIADDQSQFGSNSKVHFCMSWFFFLKP